MTEEDRRDDAPGSSGEEEKPRFSQSGSRNIQNNQVNPQNSPIIDHVDNVIYEAPHVATPAQLEAQRRVRWILIRAGVVLVLSMPLLAYVLVNLLLFLSDPSEPYLLNPNSLDYAVIATGIVGLVTFLSMFRSLEALAAWRKISADTTFLVIALTAFAAVTYEMILASYPISYKISASIFWKELLGLGYISIIILLVSMALSEAWLPGYFQRIINISPPNLELARIRSSVKVGQFQFLVRLFKRKASLIFLILVLLLSAGITYENSSYHILTPAWAATGYSVLPVGYPNSTIYEATILENLSLFGLGTSPAPCDWSIYRLYNYTVAVTAPDSSLGDNIVNIPIHRNMNLSLIPGVYGTYVYGTNAIDFHQIKLANANNLTITPELSQNNVTTFQINTPNIHSGKALPFSFSYYNSTTPNMTCMESWSKVTYNSTHYNFTRTFTIKNNEKAGDLQIEAIRMPSMDNDESFPSYTVVYINGQVYTNASNIGHPWELWLQNSPHVKAGQTVIYSWSI